LTAAPGLLARLVPAHLLREGSVVAVGLAVSSLATLLGMRLLTELVAPALFGGFALANGLITLLLGLLVQPLAQAAFRFWPEHQNRGTTGGLVALFAHSLWRRLLLATGLVAMGAAIDRIWLHWLPLSGWALLLLGLVIDSFRTRQLTFLNAAGRQGEFALLTALDAVARPLAAAALVVLMGASLEALLAGQALGAGLVLAGFLAWSGRLGLFRAGDAPLPPAERATFGAFALPLSGIALVGWATGMADRYIVGGLLGLAAAGTYAAAYALGSRPLLLLGQITDSTLRQRLYAAHGAADPAVRRQTLRLWLAANLATGLLFTGLLWLMADLVVRLLLGAAYRAEAAALLPWIALGHVFYLGTQAIERILYAAHRTRLVLFLQAMTAAIGIVAAWAGAYWAGALGVAVAVPVTFGTQLLMTAVAVQHSFRRDFRTIQ
jgi:O-antigen/teichoic acid export membrane protein